MILQYIITLGTNLFYYFFSDLSGQGEIQSVILDAFSSQNEEVKAAASYALGKTQISLRKGDLT